MAVSKSYNRHTNTWYAYETEYIWDESRQKKVQKRKCIGKIDPETNEIIATGNRGRPQIKRSDITADKAVNMSDSKIDIGAVIQRITEIEEDICEDIIGKLDDEVKQLKSYLFSKGSGI